MEKLKVYQITAGVLLLLNLVLLAFIFVPGLGRNGGPGNAIKALDMTGEQHDKFLTLAQAHSDGMREFNRDQRELLRQYFAPLATDAGKNPGPLPEGILRLEEEKIASTYQHLLEVKGILTPEQKEKFPNFVDQSLRRILGGQNKRGPRKPK
jgi:Spy/CpxP family protein refolding chaperone